VKEGEEDVEKSGETGRHFELRSSKMSSLTSYAEDDDDVLACVFECGGLSAEW
jgi:hypothetical protein